MKKRALLLFAAGLTACSGQSPTVTGPGLQIQVAPLTLPGVADACYNLAVYNVGSGAIAPSALVWSEDDVCADQYGDGRGAVTYIGTCDASPSGRVHTVSLVLNGLCSANDCDVADDEDSRTIPSTTYQNPCPSTDPCLLERPCTENADTLVEFNLTIMRDANQGFFDVAVNFEDVFCSAKLDCVDQLLHRPGGARDLTAVLGFACTSGADETCLYATAITLDCGGTNVWTIDPSQGPGNITENSPLLYGAAVYEGDEAFTAFQKSYWNVALGLDETQFATFQDCTLSWSTTASEGALAGSGPFTTPADSTYPVIEWERDIIVNGQLACSAHPLNVTLPGEEEDGPSVATDYTEVTTPGSFAYTNCEVDTSCVCPDGFTANPAGDGCSSLTTTQATAPTTTFTVCAGGTDTAYSLHGTRFSTSLNPGTFEIPESGSTTATCTDPAVCVTAPTEGIGYLSEVGVWACSGGPLNTFIGFSQCITIPDSGTYLVGIAGDNHVRLELDGDLVYQSASDLNFRTWNVLRLPLTSGQHILELFGLNEGSAVAFGAEIWGPFAAAEVATPALMRTAYNAALAAPGQPLRVFSTRPMRTADPSETFDTSLNGSSGYTCPDGAALNLCGTAPSCTVFQTASCQPAPL